MSMSALERAARALCSLDGHPEMATMEGKPLWQDYLPEARAVLQAIREPSEAMVQHGLGYLEQHETSMGNGRLAATWRGMIDTALSE